jgi:hypothetical protein
MSQLNTPPRNLEVNQMNEGTLLGRIGTVRGEAGFMARFRLPVNLSYQAPTNEFLDVVNVVAAAYLLFAKAGILSPTGNSQHRQGKACLLQFR